MSVVINEESNLVQHAKRELKLIGEDPEVVKPTLEIISIFSQMGHSGASAGFHIAMLEKLLRFENLSPLTNDPDEWHYHGAETWGHADGVWQNRRNGEAFSHDGGKTYYLLSEGGNDRNRKPLHTSEEFVK